MEHGVSLISTIAFGFGLALIFGFIALKLKIPALVGYLFAGILIGPTTPGFVADMVIASQLSEIGVMLLMFGVGLHFSLDDLLSVKRIAIPGAIIQMGVATLLGMGVALWWGWSFGAALIFGVSLSCASTVVLLKALEARGILESMNGRIAVGWLVMEDLATVLVLVLLPPLAGILGGTVLVNTDAPLWLTVGKTLLQVVAFIAIMLFVGRRVIPWCIWQVARTGSRELFTLSVIAVAVSIAYAASELFGVSFALGAFFAGMVLRESEFSHRAAEKSLPLRDAFAVLFFVSVGMLFKPEILVDKPLHVLSIVAIIIVGKSIAAAILAIVLRYPLNTAMTVAASLAQIGEFSFILASLGVTLGLLPDEGYSLILAGAIISIALNPFIFSTLKPISNWILKHSAYARRLDKREDPYAKLPVNEEALTLPNGHVVLVGYGRVGKRIAEALKKQNLPYMVVEQNRTMVELLRNQGISAISGDATEPEVLMHAHIAEAGMLIIATPDAVNVRKIAEVSRTFNPAIEIVLRTHSEEEASLLQSEKIGIVFFGEEELAKGMTNHVLTRFVMPQS